MLSNQVCFVLYFLFAVSINASAQSGISLSSSSILIDKGESESSIDVKNTSPDQILLYSKVVKLPDDDLSGGVLYTDPQATLINPGESQTIRVFYKSNIDIEKEHMARIIFTGLPSIMDVSGGKVNVIIGHELPVVIGFSQSMAQSDIWSFISLSVKDGKICMSNPTKKVFRFDGVAYAIHSRKLIKFNKPYLLPGDNLCEKIHFDISQDDEFKITTMSDYNYKMQDHVFKLGHN